MSSGQPRNKPVYVRIAEEIRAAIADGTYAPGDRLPTERQLVTDFGVARMTVRHALEVLERDGLIDRRRGRTGGTFVRPAETTAADGETSSPTTGEGSGTSPADRA